MYFHLDFSRTIIKKSRVLIINKLLANLAAVLCLLQILDIVIIYRYKPSINACVHI